VASDLDRALEFLGKSAVQTSQGSYVKMEDLKKYLQSEDELESQLEEEAPKPKTMVQAKRMAARDEELFPKRDPREPGRAIGASPQSPSRA
jgi:hypothetical protein